VPYAVEGAGGEKERAYRLCGCASEGATPQPIVSIFPSCRVSVRGGEHICARRLAERDASVAVEDWQHAEKVLEAMAEAMRVIGLPRCRTPWSPLRAATSTTPTNATG
jgi:hypothetical protein